jgi:hypothetical protein
LGRRKLKVVASSEPLSMPGPVGALGPSVISRSCTAASSMKMSRMPVSLKSSSVVSRVTELAGCSPRAASTASAVARMVPPTQKPRVLILSYPVISCTTLMAARGPCSM